MSPDDLLGYRSLARAIVGQVIDDLTSPQHSNDAAAWLFGEDDLEVSTWRATLCDPQLGDISLEHIRSLVLASDYKQLKRIVNQLKSEE